MGRKSTKVFVKDLAVACAATARAAVLTAAEHWIISISVILIFVLLAVFASVPFALFVVVLAILALLGIDGRLLLLVGIGILVLLFILAIFNVGSALIPVTILAFAFLTLGVLLELVCALRENYPGLTAGKTRRSRPVA